MKFLCIIFGCPNGARKWHITDCYASIAIPIDILNTGGQARYNIVRMNDLLLDCQRGGLYETVVFRFLRRPTVISKTRTIPAFGW